MGLVGAGLLIPIKNVMTVDVTSESSGSVCTLIPMETANTSYFRQDARENKTDAQLNLKLKIIGDQNCAATNAEDVDTKDAIYVLASPRYIYLLHYRVISANSGCMYFS